jgi:hypothetical protein
VFVRVGNQINDLLARKRRIVFGNFLNGAAKLGFLYDLLRRNACTLNERNSALFPRIRSVRGQSVQSASTLLLIASILQYILPHFHHEDTRPGLRPRFAFCIMCTSISIGGPPLAAK